MYSRSCSTLDMRFWASQWVPFTLQYGHPHTERDITALLKEAEESAQRFCPWPMALSLNTRGVTLKRIYLHPELILGWLYSRQLLHRANDKWRWSWPLLQGNDCDLYLPCSTVITNLFLYLNWNITLWSTTAIFTAPPFSQTLAIIFLLCFYEVDMFVRFQVNESWNSMFLCACLISFIIMSSHILGNDRALSISHISRILFTHLYATTEFLPCLCYCE